MEKYTKRKVYFILSAVLLCLLGCTSTEGIMQARGTELTPPLRNNLPRESANRMSEDDERAAQREADDLIIAKEREEEARKRAKEREAQEKKAAREKEAQERKAKRESGLATHSMMNVFFGLDLTGGLTPGTDSGLLGAGLIGGSKWFSLKAGVLFYPGFQKDKAKEYLESSAETEAMGFDFAAFYSLLYPKWHISVGGGGALFRIYDSDSKSEMPFVPNFQTWFNWNVNNLIFLKIGYRGDFYPGAYRGFFYKSPDETGKTGGVFFGHNLMAGLSLVI